MISPRLLLALDRRRRQWQYLCVGELALAISALLLWKWIRGMANSTLSLDDQIKLAELALKERDLADRRTWMKNPAVIGAVITGWVALSAAVFSGITSCFQIRFEREKFEQQLYADREKFQEQLNANIILKTLEQTTYHNPQNPYGSSFNATDAFNELELFLNAGLLTDKTGAIKKTIEPPAH